MSNDLQIQLLRKNLKEEFNHFESYNKEFIILSKFLLNLNLEFENIIGKIQEMINGLESEGSEFSTLFETGIADFKIDDYNSRLYSDKIHEGEYEFEKIKSLVSEFDKENSKKDENFTDHSNLIIEIKNGTEHFISEIVDVENTLNQIEKELFTPVKTFSGIFSDFLVYNVNSESDDIMQFINNAINDIANILKDYKLIKDLKENNIEKRNADFNIEDSFGRLIDKYSINGSYYNLNIFHKIDRNLPENIIGEERLLENIISGMLDITEIYLLISRVILEDDSINRIDISLSMLDSANGKILIRISVSNTGIAFKNESVSSLKNLFYLYEKDYPFGEIKLQLLEKLLFNFDSKLYVTNEKEKPSLYCDLEFDVL